MKIHPETKSVHRHLSPHGLKFLEYTEKNPVTLKKSSFRNLELKDKIYKLQPWPTFISSQRKKEIEEASINILKLIKSIPRRIFGNNPRRMSDYFNLPVNLVEVQMSGVTPRHLDNLLGRSDFIFSRQGLKCIEYNVSANIGGWQIPLWEALYHKNPVLIDFLNQHHIRLKNKNLFAILFEHLCTANRHIVSGETGESEMNTAMVVPGYKERPGPRDSQELFLEGMYKKILQFRENPLTGSFVCCDYPHLEVTGGCVYYKDKKITALIEMSAGMVPPEIVEVFKAGNLSLHNGPVSGLLSNKLNLALLSEHRGSPLFSREENKIIDQYIPWTRKIVPGETSCMGDKVRLEDFILSHRKNLIIKPAIGYGGHGVYIGQYVPEHQWSRLVDTAIREKEWLVQEYIESSPFLYQAGEEGCALHSAIFGFFVFGDAYAGCYVRVMPQNQGRGVINCYEGATVSVIFET